jgi:hypothetical protein
VNEQEAARSVSITERSIALAGEIKARLPHMTVTRNHDLVTASHSDTHSARSEFRLHASGVSVALIFGGKHQRGVTWPEELSATAIVQRAQEAGLL